MKRILFVDDDSALLQGLSGRLYRRRREWDMQFVSSGQEALQRLEQEQFDVIVTDLRMPGVDGCAVLEQAIRTSPDACRIVLSGYSDEEHTLRLVPLAHQYLSKPCEPSKLEDVVEACLRTKDILSQPGLRTLVGRVRSMPSPPATYGRVNECLARPDATINDVAEVIDADMALAAKVLQVANSAFFRCSKPVTRIDRAVMHLGFATIRTLVLSAALFGMPLPAGVLNIERMQKHAQRVATAMASLADGSAEKDEALMSGMLHDCGYLVLASACPEELNRARTLARSQGIAASVAEQQLLGASHAEVGAYLLGIWGLPYSIVDSVAGHHRPDRLVARARTAIRGAAAEALLAELDPASSELTETQDPEPIAAHLANLQPALTWDQARERIKRALDDQL